MRLVLNDFSLNTPALNFLQILCEGENIELKVYQSILQVELRFNCMNKAPKAKEVFYLS